MASDDPRNYLRFDEGLDLGQLGLAIDDSLALEFAADAASRAIDDWTGRFFYTGALQSRSYAGNTDWVATDDIASTEGLVVEVEGAPGAYDLVEDYELQPLNALVEGRPFTTVFFKQAVRRVRVTAVFGWPAIPAGVRQAALIQTLRLMNRRHSPYGVAGSPEMGSELRLLSRLDPDVEMLLRPYKRMWAVA